MRRRHIVIFIILILTYCSAFAFAEDKPFLPDPGVAVKATGELQSEDTEQDGQHYRVYSYSFNRSLSPAFVLTSYEWGLPGKGFTCEKTYISDNSSFYTTYLYTITAGDASAYLTLTANSITPSCTMTLYVPDGFDFVLGATSREEAEGSKVTSSTSGGFSSFQNNTFDVFSISSDGFASIQSNTFDLSSLPAYTPQHVTCISCHGTGRCGICHGSGKWQNPYYPDTWRTCTFCTDGTCSICDGTGVW